MLPPHPPRPASPPPGALPQHTYRSDTVNTGLIVAVSPKNCTWLNESVYTGESSGLFISSKGGRKAFPQGGLTLVTLVFRIFQMGGIPPCPPPRLCWSHCPLLLRAKSKSKSKSKIRKILPAIHQGKTFGPMGSSQRRTQPLPLCQTW